MYSDNPAQKPLSHIRFYILLSLAQTNLHPYALEGAIHNLSLGTIKTTSGNLHRLLEIMFAEGDIELIDVTETETSSQPRHLYGITAYGLITLKTELRRLQHATKVGQSRGLLDPNEPPLDIQHLLAQIKA
jgi:DNA-binding PadR family transcriptional regulator